jgi:hypothetical protein
MTPEQIRIKELEEALGWIAFHLQFRPGLATRLDLVTECERNSLSRVLNAPATEIVKARGGDILATGFEVALIGRLPVDQVSSEVEAYIYAMRGEIESLKHTQKRLLDGLRSIANSIDNSCIENDWLDGDAEWAMALADEIDPPQEANSDLPYDGETPFGIALDGGAGDDL